ncbi:MAG: hypothetical protein ABEH43_06385, partial [Flavobacteriales bacterium]
FTSTSGGTTPYDYSIDGGSNYYTDSTSFPGQCAGTYTVIVRDANGCDDSSTVIVEEPDTLELTTSNEDANCGQEDGQVSVSVTGGTTPYSYSWDSSGTVFANDDTASGLPSGNYNVTVTDDNGCTETATASISDIGGGTVTINEDSSASCFGACDGGATAHMSGGTPPYSFDWDGGDSANVDDSVNTGLCGDSTYSVTVTDDVGCIATNSITINQPNAISITETHVNVTCNGGCDGSIDASVSGGTTPYSYSWDNGENTQDIDSLCAGAYQVTVTDSNGCQDSLTINITEPTPVTVDSTNISNVSCYGACDGEADGFASGGSGAISYTWEDSTGSVVGNSSSITGLCAGDYQLFVSDDSGCTDSTTITITQPDSLTLTTSSQDANCGQNDGIVTVSVSGGTPGYDHEWVDGFGTIVGTTDTVDTLSAGTYTVTVTDTNGCSKQASASVGNASGGSVSIAIDKNVSCNGVCDGQATAHMSGGTPPYTFNWDGGDSVNADDSVNTGLCGDSTYNVTVTDSVGCQATDNVTISQPNPISISAELTHIQCFGDCDGSADLTVTGGTSPYDHKWDDGATSEDRIGVLCAGTYTDTITDDNGCQDTITITINEPPQLVLDSSNSTDVTCNGACNGTAQPYVSGGTTPYSYSWDTSGTTVSTGDSATGLCAATYDLTVTDDSGCTVTATKTITEPNPLSLDLSVVDANCGQNDGQADVDVTGGTQPYTYEWDSSGTTIDTDDSLEDVSSGSYTAIITDDNGCKDSVTANISDDGSGSISFTVTNVSCNGGSDGAIDLDTSGGTPPFSYDWSGPNGFTDSTQDISGLEAGIYSVTVTDDVGCTVSGQDTVNEPDSITSSTASVDASCKDTCDGEVSVSASGGTVSGDYSYSWVDTLGNSEGSDDTATGLCDGDYIVTITDDNGCTHKDTATVNEPNAITVNTDHVDASCGQDDGEVSVTGANGGSGNFVSFEWDSAGVPIGSGTTVDSLFSGTYNVVVTDDNGCTGTAS